VGNIRGDYALQEGEVNIMAITDITMLKAMLDDCENAIVTLPHIADVNPTNVGVINCIDNATHYAKLLRKQLRQLIADREVNIR
jgi:hypothetical protein